MTAFLVFVHEWLGYAVSLLVLIVAFMAFGRAKDAREFRAGPFAGAMILLDIQVTIGLVQYVVGGYWDARPEIAYIHPILAIAALGVGHAMLGRARKQQMAADAHRTVGRGLLIALALLFAAIGVASAPPFL